VGTVGGGGGEGEVIEAAREVLETGEPRTVRVDLTRDFLSWSPAVCGGVMDVFVEAIDPEPAPGEGAPPPLEEVRIRYLRPPDREELFRQRLVHDGPDAKVTLARWLEGREPVRVEGRPVLEPGADAVWFTFPDTWHDIGRFHLEDGTFTGLYANVLTPPRMEPPSEAGAPHLWETTDLFLDLWLPAGGDEPRILDREQLDEAERRGWVDGERAARAREEVERILRAHGEGTWPPAVVEAWTRERALLAHSSSTTEAEQRRSTST